MATTFRVYVWYTSVLDNKVTYLHSPSSTTGACSVNMLNTLRFNDMLFVPVLEINYCRLYHFPLTFAALFL